MPYTAEIRRSNPSCFLFLIDQSSSMLKPFGVHASKTKAQGVADAINRLLQNLSIKCGKEEGVRDYFHVGVIGYGGSKAASAFSGSLADRRLIPISEIAVKPLRLEERTRKVEDGTGGLVEQKVKLPVWCEAKGEGKTPMCQALAVAGQFVAEFIGRYPACFPPIVVNITDGMPTDGDPQPMAAALRALTTQDGNVLLFNAHLSSRSERPVEFPDKEDGLADKFARLLFRMSSLLPAKLQAAARSEGLAVGEAARGFVFNADLVAVIRFIDIGTKVSQALR